MNTRKIIEVLPQQKELWLLSQNPERSVACNIIVLYEITGSIEKTLFREALLAVVDKHESLRATFLFHEFELKQVITSNSDQQLDYDLIDRRERSMPSDINQIVDELYLKEFDLSSGPLFKVRLIQTERDRYIIVFVVHHIVADGASFEVIVRDLMAFYEKKEIPRSTVTYAEYVGLRNSSRDTLLEVPKLDFWLNLFRNPPDPLVLPYDYDRPKLQTFRGDSVAFELTEELSNRLKKNVALEKTSLLVYFLAIYKLFLNKLSQQEDLVVGVPLYGRNQQNRELVGMFINTLPIRSQITANSTFKEYLATLTKSVTEASRNRNVSLDDINTELNSKRDFGRNILFDVMLVLHNNFRHYSCEQLEFNYLTYPKKNCRYDLTLNVVEDEKKFKILLEYNSLLFKRETIVYWVEGLNNLLAQILENHDLLVNQLKIFSIYSNEQLVIDPAEGFSLFERKETEQSIVSRFESQVRIHPENIAVFQNDEGITYKELNDICNARAEHIKVSAQGMGLNIALLLGHGKEGVIGILSVLKSGNVYVPLDPSQPEERLVYILLEIECKIIVASNNTLSLVNSLIQSLPNLIIVNIDASYKESSSNLSPLKEESGAYILYTSGSTGKPKGVMQNHKNVMHFSRVYTNNLKIGASDRISMLPIYCFDSAVMDIYGALLNGATLYPYDIKKFGIQTLANWMIRHQITIVHTVPTVYRSFVAEVSGKGLIFPHLRLIVLGGEAVYRMDFENFKSLFEKHAFFINGYGPTESTITTQKIMNKASEASRRNISVGVPVSDTLVYLLDDSNRKIEVPYQVGEIVYKSDYLALGYYKNPILTAKVFTKDPMADDGRVYHSGDFGQMLPSGEIEFIGRKDSQVKLNGHRIELVEIEQVLKGIPEIDNCMVIVKEVNEHDRRLVSYYVSSSSISTLQLRKYLSQKLPLYFLPSLFIRLHELPKTASGKSDRRRLELMPLPGVQNQTVTPPSTAMEKGIAEIWKEVLECPEVNCEDDFFNLGGSSLMAVKVISLIKERLSVELTVLNLIYQTLFDVASICERKLPLPRSV